MLYNHKPREVARATLALWTQPGVGVGVVSHWCFGELTLLKPTSKAEQRNVYSWKE